MFDGEVPERSKGADCKSVGSAFEGPNPSLSITMTWPGLIKEYVSPVRDVLTAVQENPDMFSFLTEMRTEYHLFFQ